MKNNGMKFIDNTPTKSDANTGENFQYNFIKKSVRWHDKKSGNKRVVINKNDLDIDVGDEIYLINLNQFEMLNKSILDYETQINKLENDLKLAIEKSDKKYENDIHKIKEKHQQEIENLKNEINQIKQANIDAITDLNNKHNQKLDNLNDEIKQLQHQHNQDIKEYQQSNQKAMEQIQSLLNENNQLKANQFDYAIKYNQLRQEILNISWFGAIRNKHKTLLNDYPVIKLSDNPVAIEVNTNKENNQD